MKRIKLTIDRLYSFFKNLLPQDYNLIHAKRACQQLNIKNKKCLIVGCNTGKDCSYFIKFGAKEVHGVDVINEVGAEYKHSKVRYFRLNAQNMYRIKSNSYDLVYSFATMEHVAKIKPAFKEFVRVAKKGGIIYTLAAPLWLSRNGHHKSEYFNSYPWIHLRLNKNEIYKYCIEKGIKDTKNHKPMKDHIDDMLSNKYFNKTAGHNYVDVCNKLKGIRIIQNNIDYDDKKMLTPNIYKSLSKMGYREGDLLGVTHTFIAKKV